MIKEDPRKRRDFLLGILAVGVAPFMVNGWINIRFSSVPWVFWGYELISWILWPATLFWLAVKKVGLRADEIGLCATMRGGRGIHDVVFRVFAVPPLAYAFDRGVNAISHLLLPSAGGFSFSQMVPDAGISHTVVALYFAVSAGLVEELYWRGLFFRICQYYAYPSLIYITLMPLLFCIVHWEQGPAGAVEAGFVGLLFGWLYLRWHNLWPLIAAHTVIDYFWFS